MSDLTLATANTDQNFTPEQLNKICTRTPLRFITCGSVDDGKSTLIGRLLWDTKAVKQDQAERLKKASNLGQNDLQLPDFALLLDGLQAEREQGITIDVAYRYFSTKKRSFIVADTPGHEQYTRNMATGASTADLAILLVDARIGILEQTKRHAMIAAMMGIKQFILAVNKIDLTNYEQAAFEKIKTEFSEFALSLGITSIISIPICATLGENIAKSAQNKMPWYQGQTLLEVLELASIRSKQTVGFRMPIQRVCRPNESFRGFQGSVAGGSVKPGDSVLILPSGLKANVTKIVTFDLVRNAAVAGDAITLVLDRQIDISRGDMITSPEAKPLLGFSFDANVISLATEGIKTSKKYWLKSASKMQRVLVEPYSAINLNSGIWSKADDLPLNTIGKVKLKFEETAIFDSYEQNYETGSFILIDPDTNNTIAGGMIISVLSEVAQISNDNDEEIILMSLPINIAKQLKETQAYAENKKSITQIKINKAKAEAILSKLK